MQLNISYNSNSTALHYVKHLIKQLEQLCPAYGITETIANNMLFSNSSDAENIFCYEACEMPSRHFINNNAFIVYEKKAAEYVAIFNSNVQEVLAAKEPLLIAYKPTIAANLINDFLQKALPQYGNTIQIDYIPIKVDYIQHLNEVLPQHTHGILMPLHLVTLYKENNALVDNIDFNAWLADKKIMILPALECTPPFGQGTYILEANPNNKEAIAIINALNNQETLAQLQQEAKALISFKNKYGIDGNSTSFTTKNGSYTYVTAYNADGIKHEYWEGLPNLEKPTQLCSSANYMKGFFKYAWNDNVLAVDTPSIFVANYKALAKDNAAVDLQHKKVFVSGTRTWFEMAKQQHWLTASADALGFEYFVQNSSTLLFEDAVKEITIITNNSSAMQWQQKGYKAFGNYDLETNNDATIIAALATASHVFWTSFKQFEYYNRYVAIEATHICVGGETANSIFEKGVTPVIFPTIKAFLYWQAQHS
jgi:hypothetical protein